MRQIDLDKLSIDQLLQRFTEIALSQDAALWDFDTATFNRLYEQMEQVSRELRSRPGDQRRALVRLFGHPNPQVRLKAARTALGLEPVRAREVIQAIWDKREYPQAGDASLILQKLDDGTIVLD